MFKTITTILHVEVVTFHCSDTVTGRSLHYIERVLRVLAALASYSYSVGLQSYLLGRAGDCCFMIVQNWTQVDIHRKDYANSTTLDCDIMVEVEKDMAILGISLEGTSSNRECKLLLQSKNKGNPVCFQSNTIYIFTK
jgi:hypothetical protein